MAVLRASFEAVQRSYTRLNEAEKALAALSDPASPRVVAAKVEAYLYQLSGFLTTRARRVPENQRVSVPEGVEDRRVQLGNKAYQRETLAAYVEEGLRREARDCAGQVVALDITEFGLAEIPRLITNPAHPSVLWEQFDRLRTVFRQLRRHVDGPSH